MSWIPFAILVPLMFVIYQGVSKLLPNTISVFLVNAYASLVGAIIMFVIYFTTSNDKSLYLNSKNFTLAVLIGIFIVFGNFFIIKAYSLGAPQSLFSTIVYTLLVVFGTIAGVLVWHEKINIWQFVGILLSIAGIILVFYFKDGPQMIK